MADDRECVVCGKRTSDGSFCAECGHRERPAFMRVVGVSAALSWAVLLTGLLGLTAWHWHPLLGSALTAAGAAGFYESLKLFRKRPKWFK